MAVSTAAIERALEELSAASFVAHREVLDALPALRHHGDAVVLRWLNAARRLFEHDCDAGKAFIRGSREVEKISETVLPWTEQALAFLRWPASGPALEGYMKNLPRAFGALGHAGERRWAEIGFIWYARHAESGRAYFAMPVLDLASRQGVTGVEQLCAPIEELYESRKLMLATCLAGAIRVRNLLGAQAILPWASRGADIMQSGRARGEAYFRLESEESLSVLLDHLPGFRMAERNRLLALLLDVWYERQFELRESSWSPEKGRPFVETDGRSVFMPAVMPDRDEAILAVLHAAGHLAFGGFDRAALQAVFREAGAELPASGPIAWAPLFERYGDDVLRFRLLFDACEDLRIDSRVQCLVPNYLSRLHATGLAHRLRPVEALPYYDWALTTVRGALAAARGEPADFDPRLRRLLEPDATIADAFRVANELYRETALAPVTDVEIFQGAYLPGRAPNAARSAHAQTQQEQPQQTQAGADGENQERDEGGQQDDQQNADTGGQQSGEREKMVASEGKSAGSSKQSLQRSQTQEQGGQGSDKGKPYPEWDYREGRYKRNWSWVQEKPLGEANLAEANRLTSQYAVALKRLKKAIQAQKPTRLAPRLRQFDGDDIDLNAVVAYVAEQHAGMSPQPAIYRRRELRHRDVSVTLLADMSTSILQRLPDSGERLIDR
ncbi:MAG: VWA domain-containing protein, partial [Betaproteobacteria bacterium]|nr:VWA domain-containing protein [Betaproteobacteria bacterium]